MCFFKQKTAYEMRISDWSSDVCSSDLNRKPPAQAGRECLANCTRTGVKEKIMTETIKLLRIYTDEAAYLGDRKVLEVIASRARDAGLAGITVLDARLGFGRSAHVHRRHVFESDRAVVIEIVDEDERLRTFVDSLDDIPDVGLMTLEPVEMLGGKARQTIAEKGA